MTFCAEDGTDSWIFQNVNLPVDGFYVDVGCAHPRKFSQTAFLRDRGWKGLAIDGNVDYAPEWSDELNATFVHAVISPSPKVGFLKEPSNALVSRIHPLGEPTNAHTLDSILAKYGVKKVDFLALDVEGVEFDLLHTLNLSVHEPTIIVSEYNSAHGGKDLRVLEHLMHRGYAAVHITGNNLVFLRK